MSTVRCGCCDHRLKPPTQFTATGLSRESRRLAGILIILVPTVAFGGTSILTMLVGDPESAANELRRDLWRAGHAHAGIMLILSLVALRYVDEATLSDRWRGIVRHTIPAAAILLPVAFFLSVLSPDATEPNALINLAYVGAVSLSVGLVALGIGLIRAPASSRDGILAAHIPLGSVQFVWSLST